MTESFCLLIAMVKPQKMRLKKQKLFRILNHVVNDSSVVTITEFG